MQEQLFFNNKSKLSTNGKKASEAHTKFLEVKFSLYFIIAIFVASYLFICPAPIPTVCLFFTKTIAFDFVCFTTLKANKRS